MTAKIVKLDIQNVMRIKAVSITPDGNVVILGGRNAQGKTSVLDSICMAIGGKRLCPDVPIREGKSSAVIELNLGDMWIERSFFTADNGGYTSKLTVKNAEGQPLARPQELLDNLVGRLAFDPLEFARMKPTDARETLRALVGLDVEQLEEELGLVFRERTEAGVAKRAAQAVVDELPVPRESEEPIEMDALMEEMRAAAGKRSDFEKLKGEAHRLTTARAHLNMVIDSINSEIAEKMRRRSEVEIALDGNRKLLEQAEAAVEGFQPPQLDDIQGRVTQAQTHNTQIQAIDQARDRYAEKVEQAEAAAEKWKSLDTKHNQIFYEIKKRTEAVEYPIPDMELRKEGVFYQGVPFEQGSRAERIKVSMAMGVAMNKELGILLIRDGSVLDKDSMEMVAALAAEHGMQFWVEMARGYEGVAGAIVIEDGEVVA